MPSRNRIELRIKRPSTWLAITNQEMFILEEPPKVNCAEAFWIPHMSFFVD